MSSAALSFRRVAVRGILHDISLEIPAGQITVLLGRNGSGKTTLLQCAIGMRRYDGDILLHGEPLQTLPPEMRARRVALLPQMLPRTALTVRELVSLSRSPYTGAAGRLSAADEQAVMQAMTCCGVEQWASRRCDRLSGGERQRAFLALLLAQQADTLLLDEPGTYLDPDARKELYTLLTRLSREEGRTLVVVMHDLNEAIRLMAYCAVLDKGELRFAGTKKECLENSIPETIFGVSRHICADGELFFD